MQTIISTSAEFENVLTTHYNMGIIGDKKVYSTALATLRRGTKTLAESIADSLAVAKLDKELNPFYEINLEYSARKVTAFGKKFDYLSCGASRETFTDGKIVIKVLYSNCLGNQCETEYYSFLKINTHYNFKNFIAPVLSYGISNGRVYTIQPYIESAHNKNLTIEQQDRLRNFLEYYKIRDMHGDNYKIVDNYIGFCVLDYGISYR